jgi:hypothetical protein
MVQEKSIEFDGPGATIVSAFMTNINKRGDRSYEKYFELAKSLLKIPINKVIFIDKTVIHHFLQFANENTTIIPFEKESNYLYEFKNTIDNSKISNKNAEKDTVEYMFTMSYKTEFVRKAIHLNNYGAKQFIWMDIGIKHMINTSDEEFCEKILRLKNINYNLHVRIPSIWNPDCVFTSGDVYNEVLWYFAGSMFGGNATSLLEFADLTKETSLSIIKERNMLMWEVNVWHLIYRMDRWKFLYYISKHDNSILDNY